jgi:hypothetical protein
MARLTPLIAACAFALALAQPVLGAPRMYVGAAEDTAKQTDLVVAKAKMTLAQLAGFNAIRLTALWSPGDRWLGGWQHAALANAAAAAELHGIRIVLSVYHQNSRTTPLTPEARAEFAEFTASIPRLIPSVTDYIIGNEPNLNMFWMPQFNPDGTSASPAAYLALLAETYDALKEASPDVTVIGGSVSPRGQDSHTSIRHTHSPTRFVTELGRAYRASGRDRPVMDQFAFHPYGENSSIPPEFLRNPRSTSIGLAEYDRLVALLGAAFHGTAQQSWTLPIVYDEYGVETVIPPGKHQHYRGREHATTRPVPEATQARFYRTAIEMAYCQPTVVGMMLFHVSDDPNLDRWQSGVHYADDTPKASLSAVRQAALAAREGQIARCPRAARTGPGLVQPPPAPLRAAMPSAWGKAAAPR